MRISSTVTAIVYFIMGIAFIYIALISAADRGTVWNMVTILLAVVATMDFIVGYRMMTKHFSKKKKK